MQSLQTPFSISQSVLDALSRCYNYSAANLELWRIHAHLPPCNFRDNLVIESIPKLLFGTIALDFLHAAASGCKCVGQIGRCGHDDAPAPLQLSARRVVNKTKAVAKFLKNSQFVTVYEGRLEVTSLSDDPRSFPDDFFLEERIMPIQALALFELGVVFHNGLVGLPADEACAFDCFTRASMKFHTGAQFVLACHYRNTDDERRALLIAAITGGHAGAMFEMSLILESDARNAGIPAIKYLYSFPTIPEKVLQPHEIEEKKRKQRQHLGTSGERLGAQSDASVDA